MPVNEMVPVDDRTRQVRELITYLKDNDDSNPYLAAHRERQAEAMLLAEMQAKRDALRAHMARISKLPKKTMNGRPVRHVAGRPWQAAGYQTKATWMADGSPGPLTEEE